MLDIKWVRENTEEFAAMLANRNYSFPLDRFIELDSMRRETLLEAEALCSRWGGNRPLRPNGEHGIGRGRVPPGWGSRLRGRRAGRAGPCDRRAGPSEAAPPSGLAGQGQRHHFRICRIGNIAR